MNKRLCTIKLASQITGASPSFLKKLLREKRLVRYKIHSATYISLAQFEKIAIPAIMEEKDDQPLISTKHQ